jgi:hypothetical protein
MKIPELEQRITELEHLIGRDASYTVPSVRVTAEQTLALWQVALELARIREAISDLPTGPVSVQTFSRGEK